MDNEWKEKMIVLIKSILDNDRNVIDKIYKDLKKDEGMSISIVEDYGSSVKLHIQKLNLDIEFNLEYEDDYLPF